MREGEGKEEVIQIKSKPKKKGQWNITQLFKG